MGNINPSFNDRIRYELYNPIEGSLFITEPEGWENDDKELSRHKEYHGIFPKFSNSLKFISSGADFINFIDDVQGINAEIRLIRSERHPHTDIWTEIYSGYLDLSTKETEDNKVSVKFNSGGLEQSLKSRESEQVEIDRITTIDGLPIPELVPNTLQLKGRRIFLKSRWELKAPNDNVSVYVESNAGNTRHNSVGIPFQMTNKSHENAHSVIVQSTGDENRGSTGMMFFAVSDRQRILNISLNFKVKLEIDQEDIQWAFFNINITRYANGIEYNAIERINLFSLPDKWAIFNAHGRTFNVSYQGQVFVNIGESLAIEALEKSDLGGPGHAELRVKMSELNGEMKVDENSFFEPSDCKFVLAHELAERLIQINTNKSNVLYSDFLGRTDIGYPVNGQASLTGNTHGFWVRGFDKLPIPSEGPPVIENKFKPFTTSFKDFMSSYGAVWNLGLGIEQNFRSERIRMEPLSYFYNFNVTIKLPNQVSKLKRSCAADYFYSGIEIGYEEGGTYEEAMGLDEYNAKSTFTTIISRVKNSFMQLSKYRADSYGKEFARRKPEAGFDSEDTPYDSSVFMMDLIKEGSVFRERVWQDDFANAPTGIFSPETATNLRLSPFNMMLRHGWEIASGLIKYPTDYVRYGSSTANSVLKTKIIGGIEYAENGNIINSELQRARFQPEWIEFEHECTFEVMQQVQGKTIINGKSIQNFYGLVEFTNEKGKREKGFLFNLKPNGNGQWKLLKANR